MNTTEVGRVARTTNDPAARRHFHLQARQARQRMLVRAARREVAEAVAL